MFRILVTNQKGGVGKSTISANLVHYFAAQLGKRTTLLDFDSQGSSSRWIRGAQSAETANPIRLQTINFPKDGGFNRLLIDVRKTLRTLSDDTDILLADLTWNDFLDGELLFEFDLVVMPSAVSEVELVTTIEFAKKHKWVFEAPRYHPTLVIAPSRVRADQITAVHSSSERFPVSFVLTPPILDAVDARRAFAEQFLVKHKNKRLQDSFLAFARAIEQAMALHSANNKRPATSGIGASAGGSPLLHSNLKYRVAVSQAERNATTQTTVTHVGKPLAIPPSIAKRPPAQPIQQSSPQTAVANGAPTSGTPIEKTAAEPAQKPVLRLVSRLFGGNGNNKR
jgi:cellulose biosynthesis protein BcsQ